MISLIIFLLAFIIFILASYGIGRAKSQDDKTLIILAPNALSISIAVMAITWILTWGFMTPEYEKDFMSNFIEYYKK